MQHPASGHGWKGQGKMIEKRSIPRNAFATPDQATDLAELDGPKQRNSCSGGRSSQRGSRKHRSDRHVDNCPSGHANWGGRSEKDDCDPER